MNKGKITHWIGLIAVSLVLLEIFSYSALFILEKFKHQEYLNVKVRLSNEHKEIITRLISGDSKYYTYSDTLGWTIRKNGLTEMYQSNSIGIRSSREYEISPPDDMIRIAAFGDSFTHCDDVGNKDTWEEKLESAGNNLEVLNFGVGGFGLDQAFLRYLQDGMKFNPDIVFIGFMTENLFRNVSVYRPFYSFYTGMPFSKPRFVLKDNTLLLIPNKLDSLSKYDELLTYPDRVLRELGENDFFFQTRNKSEFIDHYRTTRLIKMFNYEMKKLRSPNEYSILLKDKYNMNSEAFKVTTRIFDEFYARSLRNNSLPVIIIFPQREDVPIYKKHKIKQYSPLIDYLKAKGFLFIDLHDTFEKYYGSPEIYNYMPGHYSPAGNELAAKHILQYLQDHDLLDRESLKNKLSDLNLLFHAGNEPEKITNF